MTKFIATGFLTAVAFLLLCPSYSSGFEDEELRIRNLEQKVSNLEFKLNNRQQRWNVHGDDSVSLFLFGVFCALWAQNTGRSAWLWFFLGLFFSVITVMVLLWKNTDDIIAKNKSGMT